MTPSLPIEPIHLAVPFLPLIGALFAGFLGPFVHKHVVHLVTILLVFLSYAAAAINCYYVCIDHVTYSGVLYTWSLTEGTVFHIGFLVDALSSIMMCVVTFVSGMVHIYSIGYMADDPGDKRFFAYISLFTFAMLMLVMGDNCLQLFFGWEAVGLVSYLLIGFWFTKPTAIYANLKAFLVNRVGDFGFLIGIALLFSYAHSLNYVDIFSQAGDLHQHLFDLGFMQVNVVGLACFCLFIGAMGKSAQFPLHVWLPDSMEGPTPISALIHAATMVTAGIYMVSRFSPLYSLSLPVLSFIIVIGAITAFFMGLLGIIQFDIKRVIAYSTLSQLGYMTVALGCGAYPLAIFHLVTHAFFKAVLFLAAGSVIIGMHHNQDMRYMGGLWSKMPITWLASLIGSLALVAFPFFSGFYSKDLIIEAAHASAALLGWPGTLAYYSLLSGVFITSLYSFRLYFMVFHGKPRHHEMPSHGDHHAHHHAPKESPWTVCLPLILLAIPSVFIGYVMVNLVMDGSLFAHSIHLGAHSVMSLVNEDFHGPLAMASHAVSTPAFWLMVAGAVVAWVITLGKPMIADRCVRLLGPVYLLLKNNYYLDAFNQRFFANGSLCIGQCLNLFVDRGLIDGIIVNGSARLVSALSRLFSAMQSGYLYRYAMSFLFCLCVLLVWHSFVIVH